MTNPKIWNYKKSHKIKTDQTTETTQKSRTHMFKCEEDEGTDCEDGDSDTDG